MKTNMSKLVVFGSGGETNYEFRISLLFRCMVTSEAFVVKKFIYNNILEDASMAVHLLNRPFSSLDKNFRHIFYWRTLQSVLYSILYIDTYVNV